MDRNTLVGRSFSLDLGQQTPVEVRVLKVNGNKITVEYLKSWAGRNEEFNIHEFAKLAGLKID